MFTIRRKQIDAISERLARRFEETMRVHLGTFFPERCAELGEEGVLREIEHGIRRAARYDITSERDVCKYLNFMFVYGRDFDVDPGLPWAAEILNDSSLNRSVVKMHLLERVAEGIEEPPYEWRELPPEGAADPDHVDESSTVIERGSLPGDQDGEP